MSLLSKVISNLFGGVSQQPPELRSESQAAEQLNVVSSPAYGLRKRPGTTSIAKLGEENLEPMVHFINRDKEEQYAVMVSEGDIKVFNALNGAEVPVNKPNGTDYLRGIDPQSDLRLVSVADHTFVLNTTRPVQLQSDLESATDALTGTVSFPIPVIQYPVQVPTDPDKTPSSSGGGGSGGWGGWGGLGGGGTGSSPLKDTEKPKDPTNPDKKTLTLTLKDATLSGGKVGVAYSYSLDGLLTISGDDGTAVTTTWTATGLPGGLSVSGSSISGTPTTRGSFSITVTATYKSLSTSKTYPVSITEVVKTTQQPNGQYTDPAATTGPTEEGKDYAWQLSTLESRLPAYLGDGDLVARMKAQGLNSNSVVAFYRPTLSVTVQGDSTATNLQKYFPTGTLTYGGAGSDGILGTLSQLIITGIQGDGWTPVTYFNPGRYGTPQSFPQLIIKDSAVDDGSTLANTQLLQTPNATVFYGVADGGMVSAWNLFTTLAFDACFIIPVQKPQEGAPGGYVTEVMELPVRISITGLRPTYAPSDNASLDMWCAKIEDFYQDGNTLYNPQTYTNSIGIDGFTRELHRFSVVNTNPLQLGSVPESFLRISRSNGIGYMTQGTSTLSHPGRQVSFAPPLAYKVFSREGLTKAAMGPYSLVSKLYGESYLINLTPAELSEIP